MNTDARKDATKIESSQALTLPTQGDKLNFIKRELRFVDVTRYSDGMSLSLSRHIKDLAFKNPYLIAYKDDLLKRIEELTEKSGFEKIRSLESVSFDYIRKNQEFCTKWAALVIEVRGLASIAFNGTRLDDFGLTDRILTEPEEDDSCFWA